MSPEDMQQYRLVTAIRTDGYFDRCIGGGSSRDCERGECNARAMCAAVDLAPAELVRRAEEHGEVCR